MAAHSYGRKPRARAVYFVERMLATPGDRTSKDGAAVVSGSGNVTIYTLKKLGGTCGCKDNRLFEFQRPLMKRALILI